MKLQDLKLLEARRNADHPAQEKRVGMSMFDDYRNLPPERLDRLFVSFTDIEKVGINPMSRYNTPNGIYTYPLSYVFEHRYLSDLPFASDRPHLWVIEATVPILNLEEYDNLQTDQTKAMKFLVDKVGMSRNQMIALINEAISEAKPQQTAMDASRMWNIARLIAKYMAGNSPGRYAKDGYRLHDDTIHFNTVLRKVFGYQAIADYGVGIIHPNEPTQCVFLSKESFKVVEVIDNRGSNHDVKKYGQRQDHSHYWKKDARRRLKDNFFFHLGNIELLVAKLNEVSEESRTFKKDEYGQPDQALIDHIANISYSVRRTVEYLRDGDRDTLGFSMMMHKKLSNKYEVSKRLETLKHAYKMLDKEFRNIYGSTLSRYTTVATF